MKRPALAGLLAALTALAAPAAAHDLTRLAREIGQAARLAGLARVSVSRFEPVSGREDGRGAALSESMTVALVRGGRVQTVERSVLPKLADELALDRTGAVAVAETRAVRLAPAQGVVIGRYEAAGKTLRLFARVVRLEDGLIVAAGHDDFVLDEAARADDVFTVPVPALQGELPGFGDDEAGGSPEQSSRECADARGRVNRLQEQVVELKSRYWAFRLRLGLPASQVVVNPGTTIPDASLRERFYSSLKAWTTRATIPPMSEDDIARLSRAEGESYALVRDCAL